MKGQSDRKRLKYILVSSGTTIKLNLHCKIIENVESRANPVESKL